MKTIRATLIAGALLIGASVTYLAASPAIRSLPAAKVAANCCDVPPPCGLPGLPDCPPGWPGGN